MSLSLPARPSLEWLKKTAKDKLKQLRAEKPSAVLAEAQLLLARDYGFDSWRKLKRHVEERERSLSASGAATAPALTRDRIVHGFLKLVGTGRLDEVRRILAAAPQMVKDPAIVRSDAVVMGAVDFGHHELVEWLLARGANVNARTTAQSRHTALHSAAWNGDLPMVRLLVSAGADLSARDEEHDGTPLGWAEVAIDVTNNPKCREVVDYLSGPGRA